mgnify:CR=1 FL=1
MSNSIYWSVYTKKEFEANGTEHTLWFKAGALKITESGKKYLQLYHNPDVDYYVFEPREDEEIEEEKKS